MGDNGFASKLKGMRDVLAKNKCAQRHAVTMKLLAIAISVSSIMLAEADYFCEHEKGWHWYQSIPEPDDEKEKPDSKLGLPALERLKKYQQELEEAKAEAVLNPSPQNVAHYQRMQYAMLEKSGVFAKVWMQNVYKDQSLDYTQKFPVSAGARHIYLREQREEREQKIQKLSQEYGLFFFFKNECPYCDAFAPVVKGFSEKYEWEVLAISEFGEKNELFQRNVRDNGLAETWGVNTYPSLFAVNPETGHVIPIAVGMISIEEMEERILSIVGDENGEEK
ncbi:conjugal transfer protein TraF [Alphaproteobacteria bacterium]|nr:conjugal transfer protein TraF [Alphaproteobacteria bacterium]